MSKPGSKTAADLARLIIVGPDPSVINFVAGALHRKTAFVPGPVVQKKQAQDQAAQQQAAQQQAAQQQAAQGGQQPKQGGQYSVDDVVKMLDMHSEDVQKGFQQVIASIPQMVAQAIAESGVAGKPKKKSAEERLEAIEKALGIQSAQPEGAQQPAGDGKQQQPQGPAVPPGDAQAVKG